MPCSTAIPLIFPVRMFKKNSGSRQGVPERREPMGRWGGWQADGVGEIQGKWMPWVSPFP